MGKGNGAGKQRTGQNQSAKKRKEAATTEALPDWKSHLESYREKTVLNFASQADLEAAIDLLWTDALRTLPHATPDGQALVIPTEAVPYFSRAGLQFTESRLGSLSELTPEEIKKLRR